MFETREVFGGGQLEVAVGVGVSSFTDFDYF